MASRPVFYVDSDQTNIKEQAIDFKWHSGFAKSQKQKSIYEFHQAVDEKLGIDNILEVSSKSQTQIGVALSAFNLTIPVRGNLIPVENIFQASKVFEKGGPFKDLLGLLPHEAKRDLRLKESGNLIYFQGRDLRWELTPVSIYYDWLYLNALNRKAFKSKRLNIASFNKDVFKNLIFKTKYSNIKIAVR